MRERVAEIHGQSGSPINEGAGLRNVINCDSNEKHVWIEGAGLGNVTNRDRLMANEVTRLRWVKMHDEPGSPNEGVGLRNVIDGDRMRGCA